MGTNYYAEIDTCGQCKRPAESLHIGKSSAGWAFYFMPHTSRKLETWAEWKAFLADKVIRDEYGDQHTLADLEALVERKQGLWTHLTCPDEAWGPYPREGYIDPDGYRFSVEREFS